MEPAHSPFGLVGQIARDTGWSVDYILWGVNYPTLMLMWQDFPRNVAGRKKTNIEILREMEAGKNSTAGRQGMDPLTFFRQIEEEEEN